MTDLRTGVDRCPGNEVRMDEELCSCTNCECRYHRDLQLAQAAISQTDARNDLDKELARELPQNSVPPKDVPRLDPRDKQKILELDRRHEMQFIRAQCCQTECFAELAEFLLLKCDWIGSDNEISELVKALQEPEVQAEFAAMFAELPDRHWSSSPTLMIALRVLCGTLRNMKLKEKKRVRRQEEQNKLMDEQLWKDIFKDALEEDPSEFARKPGTRLDLRQTGVGAAMAVVDNGLTGLAQAFAQ